MTIDELMKILDMQEEILQFSHFTNEDAWELGNIIVAEVKKRGLSAAVTIRLHNGCTVFQYAGDGITPYNEEWLRRKINTVQMTQRSSLNLYLALSQSKDTLQGMLLEPRDYAACGGGFPIRVEEVGVIGGIAVTGPDHVTAHDLMIKGIGKYLHVDEVPRIRTV